MYENGKVIVLYPSIIGLEHTHTHTKGLSTQIFCRDKHTFVATKDVFCHDIHVFAATKVSLSRQDMFVAIKIILMAARAVDREEGWLW